MKSRSASIILVVLILTCSTALSQPAGNIEKSTDAVSGASARIAKEEMVSYVR